MISKKQIARKVVRFLVKGTGWIMLLLLLLLLLLRLPAVQTWIAGIAADKLSRQTGSRIEIDRVSINFTDRVSLRGLYVEDLSRDTLLYTGRLDVNIALRRLLKRELNIEKLEIERVTAHVVQNESGEFNFQYLIDRFAAKDTNTAPAPKPFTVSVGTIALKDVYATAGLAEGTNAAHFDELKIRINRLDLTKGLIDVKLIEIDGLKGRSAWAAVAKKEKPPREKKVIEGFPLSKLRITVLCEKIAILESRVFYERGDAVASERFDARYLHGDNLNLDIRDISLDSSGVRASIREISLDLNETAHLRSFAVDAVYAKDISSVRGLKLEFNNTTADLSASTEYDDFGDLVALSEDVVAELDIEGIHADPADVLYFIPALQKNSAIKPFLSQPLKLRAELAGGPSAVQVKTLQVNSGPHSVSVGGTFSGLPDLDHLFVAGGSLKVNTSVAALEPIIGQGIIQPSFRKFGRINLSASFNGTLDEIKLGSMRIGTQGILRADLAGTVSSLRNPAMLSYDVEIRELRSGYRDMLAFTDSLPAMLEHLDTIIYSGGICGDLRDIDLAGELNTSLGSVETNIVMNFNEKYTDASYTGEIRAYELEIGTLLGVDSLGTLTMIAVLDGKGLVPDSLDTEANVYIEKVDYMGYLYEHFALNGNFEQRMFTGEAIMRDEHISVDFTGKLDFNDSIPDLEFDAIIDQLDLYALNLVADTFSIQADIHADLDGINPDNASGIILITDILLAKDEREWSADTVSLTAEKAKDGWRSMKLASPVAQARIAGNFTTSNLAGMAMSIVNEYFDAGRMYADSSLRGPVKDQEKFADENIEITMAIKDPVPLAGLLGIGLTRLDTAHLHLILDMRSDLLDMELTMPALEYGGILLDSLVFRAGNSGGSLDAALHTDQVILSKGVSIPAVDLNLTAANQEARMQLAVAGDTISQRLQLNTRLRSEAGRILLDIEEPLILNRKNWTVGADGPYAFYRDSADFPLTTIQSGMEAIRLGGGGGELEIDLLNFDLANLTGLIDYSGLSLAATMFGRLEVGLKKELPLLSGELDLLSIYVDERAVGDLSVYAGTNGRQAWGTLELSGLGNEAILTASYKMQSGILDGEVDFQRVYVKPFEPFFQRFATNTGGYISGNALLSGSVKDPEIDGSIEFFDVSAYVVPAQTKYSVGSGKVDITSEKMIPDMTFRDEDGREAYLKGSIGHRNFRDMAFDLKFNTDAFTFLNSTLVKDDLYYGKLVSRVNADIGGNLGQLKVRASVTTGDGTDLSIQLLSKQAIMRQEEYMLFYDGKLKYTVEQLDSIALARYNIRSAIDLTLNLAIRENSMIRLVIDPLTGDNLEVRGNADLVIRIPESGELSITGNYVVEEGNYRFSYQSLLKREFGIEQGSRIIFTGNLMEARLDLQAKYKTKASTYSLFTNEIGSLSDADARTLRKKSDVAVLLNVGGKLAAPELSFDILIEDQNLSSMSGTIERILAQLKKDESEMNQQVFSLLLFNSFSGASSAESAASTSTGAAIRSVGSMVNAQLNRLAQKAEGLVIDFDLDQYADALQQSGAGAITEIDMGISQSLANDKVVISVGSSIGVENGNTEGSALSTVAGDFTLEYKITEGGKYRVKVFQSTDYDALIDDNIWKTGVGFSYQTEFGRQRYQKDRKKNEAK